MKWIKVELHTTTEAVDFISSLFDELELGGIEIIDGQPLTQKEKDAMFLTDSPELLPDSLPKNDGKAIVRTYVETERDIGTLKRQIEEGLQDIRNFVDIGEGSLSFEGTDDKEWIDNWKEFFKPFWAAEGIGIKPAWEELPPSMKEGLVLEIDPGTAFGTGSHETTRLCIEALKKYIKKGQEILDVGCGSGILSVLALLLGAGRAVGTDIDPAAVTASGVNRNANHIKEEMFQVYLGDILSDNSIKEKIGKEKYDIAAANILADVIIPLCSVIGEFLKPGGLFLTSGIYYDKEAAVRKALMENRFQIRERNQMGDWISFVAENCTISPACFRPE